jgi:hypothetical protein
LGASLKSPDFVGLFSDVLTLVPEVAELALAAVLHPGHVDSYHAKFVEEGRVTLPALERGWRGGVSL